MEYISLTIPVTPYKIRHNIIKEGDSSITLEVINYLKKVVKIESIDEIFHCESCISGGITSFNYSKAISMGDVYSFVEEELTDLISEDSKKKERCSELQKNCN